MSTKVGLLNGGTALWNDRDFTALLIDIIGEYGGGFRHIDRTLNFVQNAGFEEGTASQTASGWLDSDEYNAWYAFIAGTCTISQDAVNFVGGAQSLKIDQTVNSGAQQSGVRLTENIAGAFDDNDLLHLIPARSGKTYRVSAQLKTASITSAHSGGATIAIRAYDEDGTALAAETKMAYVTGTQAFSEEYVEYTTPALTAYISVELRIDNETGTANFDDVTIVERGDDMRVTGQGTPTANLDVATGVAYFQIEDGDANEFVARFEVTEAEEVTIQSNLSGQDRIDIIVAKYDNTLDPDATASNVGTLEVVEGTPAGSPTAPATPANSILIAQVYVANGATAFDDTDITDMRVSWKWRNIEMTHGAGDWEVPTLEQVRRAATPATPGVVILNEEYTPDPSRPRIPTMEYAGLPTEAQLTQLLSSIPTKDFTLGENFPINNFPFLVQETYTSTPDVEQIYTTNWFGQTFTVPTGVTSIRKLDILGRHKGSLSDSDVINAKIYATSAGLPTGAALASATVTAKEIGYPGSYSGFGDYQNSEWVRFDFGSDLTVTPGTVYAIVVHLNSGIGSSTNNFSWAYSSSSVYSGGNKVSSTNSGSSWSASSSHDFCFRLFGKYTKLYPFYLEDGTHSEEAFLQNTNDNGSAGVYEKTYTTRRAGQVFLVDGFDVLTKIKVEIKKVGTPTAGAAVGFYLYLADASGHPTGSPIWSDTSTYTAASFSSTAAFFTFTPNVAVTDGSRYCFVMDIPSAGDATNYMVLMHSDTTTSNGGNMPMSWKIVYDGASWSDSAKADATMTIYGYKNRTAGRVYRCDPGHPDRQRIVGWATDTAALSAGDTISLGCGDSVVADQTLDAYSHYWLAADGFTLSTTPPSVPGAASESDGDTYLHQMYAKGGMVYVGRAIATDELTNHDHHDAQLMWAATDGDQAYTTSDTSYIPAPKGARKAVVVLKTGSTREEKGEIFLDKYGKVRGTFSGTDTSTAYTVTATWDATNSRIAITCTGATRPQSYAYFYR